MKIYNTNFDEQETIVNIEYDRSKVHFYSCRKQVINKLREKLGEPTRTFTYKGSISGASWEIGFDEKKKITSVLSRPLLIGQVK